MQKTTIYRKPVGENLFEEEILFFLMAVIRKNNLQNGFYQTFMNATMKTAILMPYWGVI
jgi:hypothetical protein